MTHKAPALALTILVAAAMSLSACGRKGPLERPPGAQGTPVVNSKDSDKATTRGPDRPFILDGLIR